MLRSGFFFARSIAAMKCVSSHTRGWSPPGIQWVNPSHPLGGWVFYCGRFRRAGLAVWSVVFLACVLRLVVGPLARQRTRAHRRQAIGLNLLPSPLVNQFSKPRRVSSACGGRGTFLSRQESSQRNALPGWARPAMRVAEHANSRASAASSFWTRLPCASREKKWSLRSHRAFACLRHTQGGARRHDVLS